MKNDNQLYCDLLGTQAQGGAVMAKHTISDLYQMQSLPLYIKVRMTQNRIRGWVDEYGEDGVYVSFSGDKDSTVLLDIIRKMYPNVLAVFVDTGLEYPEIRNFVKTFDNVEWLKPKKTFRRVIEEFGYPVISKEVSDRVYGAKKYIKALAERERDGNTLSVDTSVPNWWRYAVVTGELTHSKNGEERYRYNCEKYRFLLDAPFEVSAQCCNVMKKAPVHAFGRKTGKNPITAQMASESRMRTSQWLKNGCNGFEMKSPISNPMSFWTEQDVLLYVYRYGAEMIQNKINSSTVYMRYGERIVSRQTGATITNTEIERPICSVYGDIEEVEGKSIPVKDADMRELFDIDRPMLKTTGCERTGCMFCGYGCHLEKPGEGRFL